MLLYGAVFCLQATWFMHSRLLQNLYPLIINPLVIWGVLAAQIPVRKFTGLVPV